ncbi:MAG: phenylalanine 4-monooxygenase, partial [Coxiellaceae bacterium]|nr:phenylalanine 4-monooxygenase [Coxiellaceae bacterium]
MAKYEAKIPNSKGLIHYSDEENETWRLLIERQIDVIQSRACDEFIDGVAKLAMPIDRVPQCHEVTEKLMHYTGWAVEPVPALISLQAFYRLLANRKFPAATFIRRREELDYLQEPDIFHEFFGHCPM